MRKFLVSQPQINQVTDINSGRSLSLPLHSELQIRREHMRGQRTVDLQMGKQILQPINIQKMDGGNMHENVQILCVLNESISSTRDDLMIIHQLLHRS